MTYMLSWVLLMLQTQPDGGPPLSFTFFDHPGLSQNSVIAMAQDDLGFIWFGTEDGLNRFDGYDFTVYRRKVGGLTGNVFNDILVNGDDNLWLATEDGGAIRFNMRTHKVDRLNGEGVPNRIKAVTQDHEGQVWFATLRGVLRLDPKTLAKTHFTNTPELTQFKYDRITLVDVDPSGVVWAASSGGLSRFNAQKQVFEMTLDAKISAMLAADDGKIYLGNFDGEFMVYNPADGQTTRRALLDAETGELLIIRTIFRDSADRLWLGLRNGVMVIEADGREVHYPFDRPYLRYNHLGEIKAIMEDAAGEIWIGGYGGVLRCRPGHQPFRTRDRRFNGLSNDRVRALLVDRSGDLWVGTTDGINLFKGGEGEPTSYITFGNSYNINHQLWALAQDDDGIIWIGATGGISSLNPQTMVFRDENSRLFDETEISSSAIRVFVPVEDGLWAGGGRGLFFLPKEGPGRFQSLGVPEVAIGSMIPSSDGGLWLGAGSGKGLFRLQGMGDDAQITHFPPVPGEGDGPAHGRVSALLETKTHLWVGTYSGGISRMGRETGRFQHFDDDDGLPNLVIYAIVQDHRGDIWFSSNAGITRMNQDLGDIFNFSTRDGLPTNEFNSGSFFQHQRRIYFGSIRGFVDFIPGRFLKNTFAPTPALTQLHTNAGPVTEIPRPPYRQEWRLDADARSFTLHFSSLNMIQPERTRYAYRLEGFEDEWTQADTRRATTYTNIQPGRYTFHVKSANSNGVWSPERSLSLVVEAPFYRTGAAYLIYWLVLVSVAMAVIWTQRRLKHYSRDQERRIADRSLDLDLSETSRKGDGSAL